MTFEDVCKVCLSNDDLVRGWNRLTGNKLGVSRPPVVAAIDEACGYDPNAVAMPDFVEFVYEYIYLPLAIKGGA
jgi:hypothetical protein